MEKKRSVSIFARKGNTTMEYQHWFKEGIVCEWERSVQLNRLYHFAQPHALCDKSDKNNLGKWKGRKCNLYKTSFGRDKFNVNIWIQPKEKLIRRYRCINQPGHCTQWK